MDRARLARYGLYLALFLALRAPIYRDFPILLTNDSWDFIGAANAIAARLDFSDDGGVGLRDVRVPGYPIFQAVFLPLTRMHSDRILLLQAGLGLAGIVAALAIGRVLRAPAAGEGLAVFLILDPIYLLNEHTMMSEGLSLATLLGFVLAAMSCLRVGPGARRGALMGLLLGACVLVRVNALPFCAATAAGVLWAGSRRPAGRRGAVAAAAAMGLAALVVLGPWLWRNHETYHKFTFLMHKNRTLLIFKSMHNSIRRAPGLSRAYAEVGRGTLDHEWLWGLKARYGTIGAEEVAGRLVAEQIRRRPYRHFKDIMRSAIGFGGFYEAPLNDRAAMRCWVTAFVDRVDAVHRQHSAGKPLADKLGFTYAAIGADSAWTRGWRAAGLAYLLGVRPALFVATLAALALHARGLRRGRDATGHVAAVACLGAGYLATVAFHALTLTDCDRYTCLYDWIAVLILLLIAPRRTPRIDAAGGAPAPPDCG